MAPKPIDVEIRATGVDGARRQIRLVGDEAGNVQEKYGRAGESVAGVLAMIAHHGELSTREMKELVREGAEMLTMFGSGGAIIGGVTLLGIAFGEAFSRGTEEIHKMLELLGELDAEYVKLTAEANGNKLGVKEQDLNAAYNKKIQEIQKDAPGVFSRAWAEVLAGIGAITGSEGFLKDSFNAYAGRQMAQAIGTREEGAIRLKQEGIAKAEVDAEAKQKADELAKKLEEMRKRAFEGAAFLAVNDLSNNDNFARILGPAWKSMWEKVAFDATAMKESQAIVKRMIQETIDGATKAAGQDANAAGSAASTIAAVQRAVPLFSPQFWQSMTSYIKQDVAKAIDELAKFINERIALTIGAALADGFRTAFQKGANVGNVFAAVTAGILSSLGSMLEQIGESMLAAFLLIAKLKAALLALAPEIGIPIAIATIALGAILQGIGGRIAGNSPVGYSGGGYSQSSVSSSLGNASTGPATIVINGRYVQWDLNDPAQRAAFADFVRSLGSTGEIVFTDAA